ncbi:hypothetical protein V5799_002826 [Amblyomma americanum]|uniref:Uncharacterized protein n=1 Tax=Amblyomma americanum TaxID=6943 RepID=A0AAQ4DAQ7_AMBAM
MTQTPSSCHLALAMSCQNPRSQHPPNQRRLVAMMCNPRAGQMVLTQSLLSWPRAGSHSWKPHLRLWSSLSQMPRPSSYSRPRSRHRQATQDCHRLLLLKRW